MGEAGNGYYVDLDKALELGDLPHAWMGAHERGYVHLHQALRLTILMGSDEEGKGYEAACRKFLRRFITEANPSLELIAEVLEALKGLPGFAVYPRGESPEDELKELASAIEKAHREGKLPKSLPALSP